MTTAKTSTMPTYNPYPSPGHGTAFDWSSVAQAYAAGGPSVSTSGGGAAPSSTSPRRINGATAQASYHDHDLPDQPGASATAGPSKPRARLNPFEYEDERRRSWLRQDMPERLLESGWPSRPPAGLQHLQAPGKDRGKDKDKETDPNKGSGGSAGSVAPGTRPELSRAASDRASAARAVASGLLKDGAAGTATLPGYPPTPVTAGTPLDSPSILPSGPLANAPGFQSPLVEALHPTYAPFDHGGAADYFAEAQRPGSAAHRRAPERADTRAHPYAGLADMEARVAGMFPNNPRPFGMPMPKDTSAWAGEPLLDSATSSPAGTSGAGSIRAGLPGGSAASSPQPAAQASGPSHPRQPQPQQAHPPRSGRAGNRRKQKFTRTRTGCLTCRARRIKCDEGLPVCKRCIIAKKECQWATDEGARRGPEGDADFSRSASPESPATDPYKIYSRASSPLREQAVPPTPLGASTAQTAAADLLRSGGLVNPADINFDQSFVSTYAESGATQEAMTLPPQHAVNVALDLTSGNAQGFFEPLFRMEGTDRDKQGQDSAHPSQAQEQVVASDLAGKHQSWGQPGQQNNGAPMLTTPNFLLPWFPTAEERSLILHYCANAADLMMAIPSGLNPMLAINLPLALDSPRGVNTSADALRVTLLGIAAVHQAFLLARSGVSTAQTASMFQYASDLRNTGKDLVRRAAMQPDGARSDAALGAGTALATIDIFFGGGGWTDNFKLAKDMIAFRGGPARMLEASKPTLLQDGVSVSAARLVLEILTIYETFGSLTTGEEPTLLGEKWGDWWFKTGQTTYEEHSVEKQFGMSRVMVHLFNRLTRLLARVRRSRKLITESDDISAATSRSGNTLGIKLDGDRDGEGDPDTSDPLVREARQLNADVDAWIESLQLATLEHERVQVGNRAYAYTMKILLLRNVFRYPREDGRVQAAAIEVIRHCSHSTALLGMSIDLTWPAIIAGCCVDGDSRAWLLTLLEGFKAQCCFDIETAGRIIGEVWRRSDAGEPRADWKDVCDDLKLQVLLC